MRCLRNGNFIATELAVIIIRVCLTEASCPFDSASLTIRILLAATMLRHLTACETTCPAISSQHLAFGWLGHFAAARGTSIEAEVRSWPHRAWQSVFPSYSRARKVAVFAARKGIASPAFGKPGRSPHDGGRSVARRDRFQQRRISRSGDTLNIAPRDLTFRFSQGAAIDPTTIPTRHSTDPRRRRQDLRPTPTTSS